MDGESGKLNNQLQRDHNLTLVLEVLARTGGCSRSRLADSTGLAPGAITSLVQTLTEAGLIEAGGTFETVGGRRKRTLRISDDFDPVAVVELRHESVHLECRRLSGTLLAERDFRRDFRGSDPEDFAHFVADRVGELAEDVRDLGAGGLLALGIVVPAPVFDDGGTVYFSVDFGWKTFCLVELIEAHLPSSLAELPVVVCNDASSALWAEYEHLRAECGEAVPRNILYVKAGIGIGGAAIVDGRPYAGSRGIAMEIGHTQVELDGPVCRCGQRGCLALYADPDLILERCGMVDFERLFGRSEAFAELNRRRLVGDGEVVTVFEEVMPYLRFAVRNALNFFAPDCLILGGILAPLAGEFEGVVDDNLFGQSETRHVLPGAYGPEAAIFGGFLLMRRFVLRNAGRLIRGERLI